jgi:hypothetical protein
MSKDKSIALILYSCNTRCEIYSPFEGSPATRALSELEQSDEQVALIVSFKQPFPMQERDRPVMDGEMNSYG